jgi:cobalt/nickel transport system permease protein
MHHPAPQLYRSDFLSRTDPRLKVLTAGVLLPAVISGGGTVFPLTVAAGCLSVCLLTGTKLRSVLLRFAEPALIMGMLVLLKLFCTGESPLFSLHLPGFTITGYREGLIEGLLISSRMIGAVSVLTLLTTSTPFTEIMAALGWFRVPKGFVDIALFAWRYLFMIFDDAGAIYCAQKNRLGYTGWKRSLASFGTLTGSLVIKAFDNSRNITTSMVQRGYEGNIPMLRHKPFRFKEVAVVLALTTGIVVLRVMGS